jgi:hypothetical protein
MSKPHAAPADESVDPAAEPAVAHRRHRLGAWLLALAALGLAACGGGGDDPPAPPPGVCPALTDVIPKAGVAVSDLTGDKAWLLGLMQARYLWYGEIPAVDAAEPAYSNPSDAYRSLEAYFDALLSPATTPSGKRRDEFSFIYPKLAWDELSRSGASLGYGIEWYRDARTPPRGLRVAFVTPGSPAAAAGIRRGDVLVTANGTSADVSDTAGVNALNGALFPTAACRSSFVFSRAGSPQPAVELTAGRVVSQPVLTWRALDAGAQKVGYIAFTEHFGAAEQQLIEAVAGLKAAGISDLVLDLRYNGGGYLYMANQVAYMIAGPSRTAGKTFETTVYNDKLAAQNRPSAFIDTACVLDSRNNCTRAGEPLPTLDLGRVFVITGPGTCSASEAIINGLEGIDVQVRRLGSTTCGKPYGFSNANADRSGIAYFPIEFKGVNHKGFGDFADGFAPTCNATDDFGRELGDPTERLLAAALSLRATGNCPTVARDGRQAPLAARATGSVLRPAVRDNMYRLPELDSKH